VWIYCKIYWIVGENGFAGLAYQPYFHGVFLLPWEKQWDCPAMGLSRNGMGCHFSGKMMRTTRVDFGVAHFEIDPFC